MKTRPLHLLAPVLVLAVGYFAWDTGYWKESEREPAASIPAQSFAIESANPNFSAPPVETEKTTADFESSGDNDCKIVTKYIANGDGTVLELLACERLNPKEKHPYESYSSEALESLAYADAKAAEILGVRLRDEDLAKSMSLMIRSSALSGGDTAPIFQTFNMYPHSHEIDGVPVVKTIRTKFVLSAVADLLSGDTFHAGPWEDEVRRYSSDPEAEIALLYKQALRIIDEMRQIELEVTGSSTIGGQDDA